MNAEPRPLENLSTWPLCWGCDMCICLCCILVAFHCKPPRFTLLRQNSTSKESRCRGKNHSGEYCFSLYFIAKLMFPSLCFCICFLTLSKDFFFFNEHYLTKGKL